MTTSAPQAAETVVLVSRSADGSHLLAVPLQLARSEIHTSGVLAGSTTFADLKVDDDAAAVVAEWADSYLERIAEEQDLDPDDVDRDAVIGPAAPFDADDFFGSDNWRVWHPDPRNTTASWLASTEPALYAAHCVADGDWGLMELEDDPVIPADHHDQLVRDLRSLGYQVRSTVDVDGAYQTGSLTRSRRVPWSDDVRSHYVSPLMTVDQDRGRFYAAEEALRELNAGRHIYVSSSENARDILIALGLSAADADARIVYGQTGQLR